MLESDIPNSPKQVGDYTIERTLGVGGMGTVYLARSASGEARAIKVLHAELSGSQELRLRLEREAAVLKRLRGERSAAVYEINTTAERPYLVMEYVSGLSLDKHIEKYGKLSGVLVWAVMDALLEATEMFHAEGITHRDLKPSNIMLGENGVKIIDFGISGLMGSSLTEIGSTPATTLWSSPEQMNGAEVGQASDVFNLGMIFAYAWTGSHPFDAAKRDAVMLKLMTGEPNLAGIPSRLRQIVADCLAKDPAQRPSAREVRDRLRLISRSSSNSDSGSRSGELGSPLTGTVLVDVAETLKSRPRGQVGERKLLKNRQIAGAAVVLVLVAVAIAIAKRGEEPRRNSASPTSSTQVELVQPPRSLEDLRLFPRSLDAGTAAVQALVLDLRNDARHLRADDKNKSTAQSAREFDLAWFNGKCKRSSRTVEAHQPIVIQFSSPGEQKVEEFGVVLAHIRELLRGSGSVLADSLDGSFSIIGNGKELSAVDSTIDANAIETSVSTRNANIKELFGLSETQSRPLRITLSNLSSIQLGATRDAFSDPIRPLQVNVPSGFAVDYGWAVPARRQTYENPKEIDAASVTISREHWQGVAVEQVLAVIARGLLMGLGSGVDTASQSLLSVAGGSFVKNEYEYGTADFQIAAILGYEEKGDC